MITDTTSGVSQDALVAPPGGHGGTAGRDSATPALRPDVPAQLRQLLGGRSLVLVGMMGAGKTTIGRRLAGRLGLPFLDADHEIEQAAGMSIPEIFAEKGETYFRDGERRVIARLLSQGQNVLATGGGAFMNAETRDRVRESGISIWLKADMDVLMRRVRKRQNRPLLSTPNPEAAMRNLLVVREPIYALADVTVLSLDTAHDDIVDVLMASLHAYLARD